MRLIKYIACLGELSGELSQKAPKRVKVKKGTVKCARRAETPDTPELRTDHQSTQNTAETMEGSEEQKQDTLEGTPHKTLPSALDSADSIVNPDPDLLLSPLYYTHFTPLLFMLQLCQT